MLAGLWASGALYTEGSDELTQTVCLREGNMTLCLEGPQGEFKPRRTEAPPAAWPPPGRGDSQEEDA
jgi:hypothetical protein